MVFRCFFVFAVACGVPVFGQLPSNEGSSDGAPAMMQPRKLAPGVLTVVPATFDAQDIALGPFDLDLVKKFPELAWGGPNFPDGKPNFASPEETLVQLSKDVTFRPKRVWSLEFAFKPVRSIAVEIPNAEGAVQKRIAYYMIYAVRDPGKAVKSESSDNSSDVKVVDLAPASIRTLLRFQIVSKERDFMQDSSIEPVAKTLIEAKERVGQPLLDPIEMSQIRIPADGTPVWGVAIWMDVDPKADFFAVDVRGLTSAYQIRRDENQETSYDRKTLRIYHWRAGDDLAPENHRIRLGVPPYVGPDKEEVAYSFRDREQVLSETNAIEMRLAQLAEDESTTEMLANTLKNASVDELAAAFEIAKKASDEAIAVVPEDSDSLAELREMVTETEAALAKASESRDSYRAVVSMIPKITETSQQLIRSILSVRLLYLRDLTSELNKTLRMKDTLDKFNLEGRLDYQWVYR
ncbi:MAG: hypothetical protein MUC43_03905 [Pirellula sp.]|nr:hypothetical protein [Pirellula sp.]